MNIKVVTSNLMNLSTY